MKSYLTLLITVLISNFSLAQNQVLFFDDFEETISNDATFQKWTTENLEGWQYWHLVSWGYNSGQSMRFENNDLAQDDWLITHEITGQNVTNTLITFDVYHSGLGTKPILLYTSDYNGNASQSSWTEIEYSLGDENDAWFNCSILIEDPGDTLYFAFRSQVAANAGMLFLLDNFRVTDYTPPAPFELVGSSEHFEFYTNIEGEEQFYLSIQDSLEIQFDKLASLWNRPGKEDVFDESVKIKVYYSAKDDIQLNNESTPKWKNGFFTAETLELFLSPLTEPCQINYYNTLVRLAVNSFSQLAVTKKLQREDCADLPSYFLEGFGLYETGFRPRRDSILQYMNAHSKIDFNFISDTTGVSNSLKKDFIVASIEWPLLTGGSYLGVSPPYSFWLESELPKFLHYFYTETEDERIKLQLATSDFEFYGATDDSSHFAEVVSYFENAYSFYIANYNFKPKHRFRIVIVPTEPIGMDILNYDDYFNGGVGCGGDLVIQLSPNYNFNANYYYSDYFGYAGLSAHEFFHIYYNHFMWAIPGGFWAEGTADFSQRHSLNWPIPAHSLWNINELFTTYKQKHNVTISLEHIYTNPYFELDIYFLGDMFFEFLYKHHGGYENIMKFFNEGMDYSVFGVSYEEIDNGYINFLKSLVGITDADVIEDLSTEIYVGGAHLVVRNSNCFQQAELQVFSISGQELLNETIRLSPNQVYRESLPNSIQQAFVIVRLKTEEKVISKKLFISGY